MFAFGIGSSVNRYLIEGIARAGNGETFIATGRNEVTQIAQDFIDYIRAPVLTGISIDSRDVTLYDTEPGQFADVLGQRPLLVIGKYRDAGGNPAIMLHGRTGNGEYSQFFAFTPDNGSEQYRPLRWLWARRRIADLSDFYQGDPKDNRDEIVSLGLQYSLLTKYTSFVAVDDVIRNPNVRARNVKQPLPMPAHVSNLAIGERRSVPEPSLTLLLWLLLSGYVTLRLWRRYAAGHDR